MHNNKDAVLSFGPAHSWTTEWNVVPHHALCECSGVCLTLWPFMFDPLCFLLMCHAWLVCVCVHVYTCLFSLTYSHVWPKSTRFPCPLTLLKNPSAPSVLTRSVLCVRWSVKGQFFSCACLFNFLAVTHFYFNFILKNYMKLIKKFEKNLEKFLPKAYSRVHLGWSDSSLIIHSATTKLK